MDKFIKSMIFKLKPTKQKLINPKVNLNCSEFEVNNWIISEFIVEKLVPVVGVHPFPLNELSLLVSAVCWLEPSHIFEWGTNIGKSARVFYETTSFFGISSEIHSTDLPDNIEHVEHPKENRGILVKDIKQVILYQGDGLKVSLEIYKKIKKKIKPLFFCDGDHDYSTVRRELEGIVSNVPNASILVHDTFYQSGKSKYNIGPYRAVNDILSLKPNRYRTISQNLGLPGMTFLYKT